MSEWKSQANALFFIDHLEITDIAVIVGKARETVSRYLNDCEGYDEEATYRKEQSATRRREYQRQWDRSNRPRRYDVISKESLRREHDIAALILSKEKY